MEKRRAEVSSFHACLFSECRQCTNGSCHAGLAKLACYAAKWGAQDMVSSLHG